MLASQIMKFVMTGRTNIDKQKEGQIKEFWKRGTCTRMKERYSSVDEVLMAVQKINDL